jgi:hypothetical protein
MDLGNRKDSRLARRDRVTVAFILSCKHSGSTWLNLVLGSHTWAYNLGEYHRPFTIPGHVACRLCEADGLDACTMLHGIERVKMEDAYHFAATRSGKSVLIDASKQLDWCKNFLNVDHIDARLIHLVRHPCGYLESQSRRSKASFAELLDRWEATNRTIDSFVSGSGAPSVLAYYDDLADAPAEHMPAVCELLGGPYEPAALRYWDFPHHGLGGNGAASVYLKSRPNAQFLTGDDAFYAEITDRPSQADRRWTERLPQGLCRTALASPYVRDLEQRLGRNLTEAP